MMPASSFYFMRNVCFQNWLAGCVFIFCFAMKAAAQPDIDGNPGSDAFIKIPADTDDWTRHFHIGALIGMNISASFNEKGPFTIPGKNLANGIYDDGYVREDNSGNAFGHTGFFGYNNASQYNSSANTLTFHSTTGYSLNGSGSSSADGGPFPGFEMVYGDNLWYWKHARVGWEAGFGLLPINITSSRSISATVSQSSFTYDTTGVVIPESPYQGGFNRQGEPTIPSAPSATSTGDSFTGNIISTRTLDVMLYTLRLGPTFYWDLGEHVGMSLGAGPAIGFVSGDYSYHEIIPATLAKNSGSFGATDVTFGGYVNGTVLYHVDDNADIFAGVQFMPMSDATFSGAGREGQLNLGGQLYFSIGVNWPF